MYFLNRFLLYLILVIIFPLSIFAAKPAEIVIESYTGKILHNQDAFSKRYPASLTKMMTLYVTFDHIKKGKLSFNQKIRISKKAASQQPSKLGLEAGSYITVKEAVLSLIVKSANDMAVALAEHIAGSEEKFSILMNRAARQLFMRNSHFCNASGLPNERQVTTAYDMARLAVALERDFPNYYHLFSTKFFRHKGVVYKSHNNVLLGYPHALGLKTGYTKISGYNLVTSAKRGHKRIISVVMGSDSRQLRDKRMVQLLDNFLSTNYASRFDYKPSSISKKNIIASKLKNNTIAKKNIKNKKIYMSKLNSQPVKRKVSATK